MTCRNRRNQIITGLLVSVTGFFMSHWAWADDLNQAFESLEQTHKAGVKTQQHIDKTDDETQDMLQSYRQVVAEQQSLSLYNKQLKLMTDSQQQKITELSAQIESIEETQHTILPLMQQMLQGLKRFVAMDIPFLMEERQARLDKLDLLLVNSEVSVAEKYRQLLEAFQIEIEYGNTIEAYEGQLVANKMLSSTTEKTETAQWVQFFRMGRVGLYYMTADGHELGVWNNQLRHWQPLDQQYLSELQQAIRLAHQQQAPQLLSLPINTPNHVSKIQDAVSTQQKTK
ncbi:DUF3450 domain-containing protein [Zooshikella ganghwensis]|uniref:DUF3450 domain-containing protein n=1 Tax=Zooshikella ganghwensis TaxID=202772 RepID=A0A4P9VJN6_9GAMM|nr:DUF3450 domain-containing protein [Zooshikella ganghwensis]RDH42729.1 DUF3450 domain-containing protein [Zooshikella ganghwensis]